MKETINLRCYGCNHEFVREVDTEDFINDIDCPNCKKKKIEINIGKKYREEEVKYHGSNTSISRK